MRRSKVFGAVDFIEENFLARDGVPSPKALRKWRAEAQKPAGFTLVLPPSLFQSSAPTSDPSFAQLEASLEALEAEVLLLRPPPKFAPTQPNREQFGRLVATLRERAKNVPMAFQGRGLWDLSLAAKLSRELELLLCFDPLANDPLEEIPPLLAQALESGTAYLRLDRIGTPRDRFDPYELETVATIAEELDSGWICFAHSERVRDGIALRSLIQSDESDSSRSKI